MSTNLPLTGQPISRLEGIAKVTGMARYSGEYNVPELLYGYVVNSTITKGKIIELDTKEVMNIPGVVAVFTHENRPSLTWFNIMYSDMDAPPGKVFQPLHDAQIKYNGQPIALVVAESFELARYAASLLTPLYEVANFVTNIEAALSNAREPKKGLASAIKPPPPKPTGNFDREFNKAYAKAGGEFRHNAEHHNPIELYTTTTVYQAPGKLTIYDKTQGTINSQMYVANVFGLHFKDVRVISTYVGGAFGSGLRPQYQLFMSVMASLELKRSVRVTLDREQMFTFGHRPPTIQHTRFGADESGNVTALNHEAFGETSRFEDYTEVVVSYSAMLYPALNTLFKYKVVPVDVYSPLDMRAPGGCTGLHAIESTMDELAYQLKMDPLHLRLTNYTTQDITADRPFSSKELKACYLQGAARFGWENRKPEPRSMRNGNKLIGYGMATGMWESMAVPAKAKAVFTPQGKLQVSSAVTDIGTGTLTVMTQIAADELGLNLADVTFLYGDSKMPFAPIQGGSFTVSSVGAAVKAVTKAIANKLFIIAKSIPESPLKDVVFEQVVFREGHIWLIGNGDIKVSLNDIITANKNKPVKASKFSVPKIFQLKKYTRAAHSAAFVEVEVDEELGIVNVTRAVTAVAAGTIINPKTARSQILGGMVWGISKALHEETIMDHRIGRYINRNMGEYHIPVHADIHELDVLFVEEKDNVVNTLGSKGVGEIGIIGMAPAIANAIYHATGKRINHFPIRFNELI